jgi:hypothetical protein
MPLGATPSPPPAGIALCPDPAPSAPALCIPTEPVSPAAGPEADVASTMFGVAAGGGSKGWNAWSRFQFVLLW